MQFNSNNVTQKHVINKIVTVYIKQKYLAQLTIEVKPRIGELESYKLMN